MMADDGGPVHRRCPAKGPLLRVDIDSAIEADKTFTQLLGKDASQRYRVIMEEASEIDDLDV